MELRIKKSVGEAIGLEHFIPFGIKPEGWGWREVACLDIGDFPRKQLDALERLLEKHKKIRGVQVVLKDITTWRTALVDASATKPRLVRQFEPLLQNYIGKVPGHRVYKRTNDGEVWLPYYVAEIEFYPETAGRSGEYRPAYVIMRVVWDKFGGRDSESVRFEEEDCRAMTVAEALSRKGYYIETPELRATYLQEVKRFTEITKKIGAQYLASGTGVDDLDGNDKKRSHDGWYWSRTHTIQLVREGEPTRVVVDVFYEDAKTDRRDRDVSLHTWFWTKHERRLAAALAPRKEKPKGKGKHADDEDEDDEPDKDESDEALEAEAESVPEIEVPVHPYVAVFDMVKHLRLRVHVNHLVPYVYDEKLADKLVLDPKLKQLVELLIEHKANAFKDIIKGKSGGAVVLLAGPPGTGKTLTAEVYAEAEKRPLYSIQCSQLGTDPEELEDALLKAFARARRWNAVMLLDEADVYIHERGDDLMQNAIVGVFLRVLEYQAGVLFLSTNRPDDVDDAIASRCVARLDYAAPSPGDQARIWHTLAENAGIKLTRETIAAVVNASPDITGRDVKNLLKLAALVAGGQPISPAGVEYVKQFKPTGKAKPQP
jgi:hypothetical protein